MKTVSKDCKRPSCSKEMIPSKEPAKRVVNKLREPINIEASRPVPASHMAPHPTEIVVDFVNDAVIALVWLDVNEKVQRLEIRAINALLLADRIVSNLAPKYERVGDCGEPVFVPKGMTKQLKKVRNKKKAED